MAFIFIFDFCFYLYLARLVVLMKASFNLQIAKVVGTPSDGFWSQVHTFTPENQEKKEKRGDLLAVLVISGVPQGVEAVAAGREVLGRLHEEYYGSLFGSAFERLKAAVQKVAEENENLEIAAASLLGQTLFLAIYGEGKAFLKREGKSGVILKGNGGLSTASGIISENDLLVLGSRHFFEVVGQGILKASLESGSPDEAVETLAPIVLGRSNVAAAAAILALVKKEESAILPVAAPEPEAVAFSSEEKKSLPHKSFLGRVNLAFLKRRWLGLLSRRKPIFIRSGIKEKRKKIYFVVAIILLVLLGSSLTIGVKKKIGEQRKNKAKELINLAEEKLSQGKILAVSDVTQGRVLGAEAEKLASEALSLLKTDDEATFLKGEAENFLSSLGQEVSLNQPTVFMDLNLIADGGKGISLALAEKNLAILDQEENKIYLLNIEKKSPEIINNGGEKGKAITGSGQKIFVLDEKGILTTQETQKTTILKIEKDSGWKEIVSLSSFGGNLYLLDKGASDIWRYSGSDGSFGSKKSWFIDSSADLSQGVSMTIDGSIWILTKDKILKFTLGKPDNFSLSQTPASPRGEPEGFLDPIKIYTSADEQNLYVLDKGRGKVYVIAKSGEFKTAYFWEGFRQASDLVAIESIKKLFVLSEAKIYEVELK